MIKLKIKLLFVGLLFAIHLGAQITNTSITIGANAGDKDAMVGNAGLSGTNMSTNDYMNVYNDGQTTPTVYRSFLEFDLTSIPKNAVIISATLELTPNIIYNGVSYGYIVSRVEESWVNSTVDWNTKPSTILSDELTVGNSDAMSNSIHSINVRDHVQKMINFPVHNHGWAIRLTNEALAGGDYGLSFWSLESVDATKHPKINVIYTVPIEITGAVSHCALGSTDGSIDFTYSGGSGGEPLLFRLWKIEPDLSSFGISATVVHSVIGGTGSLNLQSIDASSLAPGLYKARIEDAIYSTQNYNSADIKSLYAEHSFLVGRHGEVTNVTLTRYIEAMNVVEYSGGGDYYYSDNNYFGTTTGQKLRMGGSGIDHTVWNYDHSSPNNTRVESFFDTKIDFPADLEFLASTIHLRHHSTYQFHNSSNAAYFTPCTQAWKSTIITWNTKPTTDVLTEVYLPKTANPSGYENGTDIIDIQPLVEYWQTHPNYGFRMKLATYNNPRTTYRNYKDFSNTSIGKIELSFTPFGASTLAYVGLKRKLTGGYYQVVSGEDVLRVKYDEEYMDEDGNLNFNIKNNAGSIQTIPSETVVYGDNRLDLDVSGLSAGYYILEVENDKNESFYLRFKIG